MNLKRLKFNLIIAYILFSIAFFIIYHFTHLTVNPEEFYFIIINFIFSFLFLFFNFKYIKQNVFVSIGLFSTIFADMFLVVLGADGIYATLGVVFFVVAQICYTIYLHLKNNNYFKPTKTSPLLLPVLIRVIPYIIIVSILFIFCRDWTLFIDNTALVLITSLYVVLSLVNITFGFIYHKRSLFMGIGLLLLFLCDIFVFIDFIDVSTPFNIAWLFYIPSQAFIVLEVSKGKVK